MTIEPSAFQDVPPTPGNTPYTPKPAATSTATITPANTAPTPRRSGVCSGSVSCTMSADVTRCIMNWYACSWSRRDGMRAPLADRGHQALDVSEETGQVRGERDERQHHDHVEDVG